MSTEPETISASAVLVAAVTPKLRVFNPEEPELWFANAEMQFETASPEITTSKTKFKYVCMALSPEIQRDVKDIFLNPPEDPYEALKTRLCAIYRPSPVEIASRVLDAPMLGDSTASALASSMLQHLSAEHQEHPVVREVFLRRLPLDIRRAIEENDTLNVRELATAADRRLKGRILPPISGPPPIAAVANTRPKSNHTQNQKPQGSSTSKTGPKTWCWLHRKFGKDARNCVGRCEWPNFPIANVSEIQEN